MEFFSKPKDMLEKWFKQQVNDHPFDFKDIFHRNYGRDFASIKTSVTKQESLHNLKEFLDLTLGARVHNWSLTVNQIATASKEDFQRFQQHLLEALEAYKSTPDLKRYLISNRRDVMERLGCTKTCKCCGAICWLARGHQKDAATRQHFCTHQPPGLCGAYDPVTRELYCVPCSDWIDTTDIIVPYEGKIKWSKAKRTIYNDWIFEKHPNRDFDDLMKHLFVNLNVFLVAHHGSATIELRPATLSSLEKHKFLGLSPLSDIMCTLSQRVYKVSPPSPSNSAVMSC